MFNLEARARSSQRVVIETVGSFFVYMNQMLIEVKEQMLQKGYSTDTVDYISDVVTPHIIEMMLSEKKAVFGKEIKDRESTFILYKNGRENKYLLVKKAGIILESASDGHLVEIIRSKSESIAVYTPN